MARQIGRRGRAGWGLLGALALVTPLLAACGGAGGGTATSADGLINIRVGLGSGVNDATPFFAAYQEGIFKKEGLNVTYVTLAGGESAMDAALASNQIDLGIGNATQFITDASKKAISGKLVGEFTDQNYAVLGAKGITSVSQLSGKTLGVSSANNGDQMFLEAVLAAEGVDPTAETYLAVGAPASRLSAMSIGRISAIEMPVTEIPAQYESSVILSNTQSPVSFVSDAIFSTTKFLADTAALKKFIAATSEASDWVRANPAAAVTPCELSETTAASCASGIKISLDKATSSPYTWSATTALNPASLKDTLAAIARIVPGAKTLTVNDIADTSIAGTSPMAASGAASSSASASG